MTRKCALCKETNYKRNNYSFFSAPKDAETRKKWQIVIKNDTVTDDTYVCSKHFQKNDIITHWVSGIPPQVIKIKYKKRRLRPGAVPSKNFHLITSSQSIDKNASNGYEINDQKILASKNKQALEDETFSKKEENMNYNENIENENINSPNLNFNVGAIKSVNTDEEKNQIYNKLFRTKIFKTIEKTWEQDMLSKGSYDKINENELLFEDFLEMCTEISIPRGWSCLVTSKGHDTTVVYLYMSITKDGLPFVEKQIFIRSDMMLHYIAANREIDPLIHNLVKDKKHSKLKNLLDLEIFIEQFDQRIICQGMYNTRNYENITRKNAYTDGVKWRHISCPLIVNNNSSRCTKCYPIKMT